MSSAYHHASHTGSVGWHTSGSVDDKKYGLGIWRNDASVYIQLGIRFSLGKPGQPHKVVPGSPALCGKGHFLDVYKNELLI